MSSSKFYASQAWTFVKTLVGVGGEVQKPKISKTFLEVASCNVLTGCMGKIYFRFQSLWRV